MTGRLVVTRVKLVPRVPCPVVKDGGSEWEEDTLSSRPEREEDLGSEVGGTGENPTRTSFLETNNFVIYIRTQEVSGRNKENRGVGVSQVLLRDGDRQIRDEREVSLLEFLTKVMRTPETTTKSDTQRTSHRENLGSPDGRTGPRSLPFTTEEQTTLFAPW